MNLPDPLQGVELAVAGVGGAEQAALVRRGMWLHATLPRPPVGQTPHIEIHRQDKLVVRYYAPATDEGLPPVVIVPSLINRAYVCDLEPDRSLVGGLARLGHPVYLVDWGVPGPEDADEGVGYVLLTLLHRSVRRVCHHARAQKVLMLGYCQGGTLAAMYTALRPERVAGLACLATPVKFSEGGRFTDFANAGSVEAIVGPDGLVDLDIMASAFKLLDPMGNWSKYIALEAASRDPRTLKRTLARERWLEENVPLPGRFAQEFVTNAYREDRLLDGTWEVDGEVVDLGNITCPVLVTPCAKDFIAPPDACTPLATAVGSDDVTVEVLGSGHIGCVVGGFGPKVYYPLLDRWFRRVGS
ncbi:MAG: alpha/beta fold hydrolase [Alphaproteobacteria bacterium]|nr:alpha/beta fold hydrolase [Alphaproteobacteria bacterium]